MLKNILSNKLTRSLFFLGDVVVGVLFIVLGIMAHNAPDVCTASGSATISRIEVSQEWTGAGDDTTLENVYTVFVDYVIDGRKYTNVEYTSYNSSMKEGDKVEIMYNPDDPSQINPPGGEHLPVIIIIVGIAVLLFGVVSAALVLIRP